MSFKARSTFHPKPHPLAEVWVPLESVDVHQHGAAGIGHVRHVNTAVHSSCQVLCACVCVCVCLYMCVHVCECVCMCICNNDYSSQHPLCKPFDNKWTKSLILTFDHWITKPGVSPHDPAVQTHAHDPAVHSAKEIPVLFYGRSDCFAVLHQPLDLQRTEIGVDREATTRLGTGRRKGERGREEGGREEGGREADKERGQDKRRQKNTFDISYS